LQHNFRVFVLALPLKDEAEGYRAMDERWAIMVLLPSLYPPTCRRRRGTVRLSGSSFYAVLKPRGGK
jgi:hypothetical protein